MILRTVGKSGHPLIWGLLPDLGRCRYTFVEDAFFLKMHFCRRYTFVEDTFHCYKCWVQFVISISLWLFILHVSFWSAVHNFN